MGLTNEHVEPKIFEKIKIYILTRAELLFNLCYEIPCTCTFSTLSTFFKPTRLRFTAFFLHPTRLLGPMYLLRNLHKISTLLVYLALLV